MFTAYSINSASPMPAQASKTVKHSTSMDSLGHFSAVRWSWACRVLPTPTNPSLVTMGAHEPKAGDLAVVQVESIGCHERITTQDNQRLRIYPGDRIVGVFGNRYATDAFEGEVAGVRDLSLLTAGGMIGTVRSRHRSTSRPTQVTFQGFVGDSQGRVMNLKTASFRTAEPLQAPRNLVAVVGTGMNAGKTTSCVKLIKALSQQGLRVAACKLTGSVSNRDQDEMRSASAARVLDFSDFGFPSTYLCEKEELMGLFHTMMAGLEPVQADITVMEIADGILQRETAMLLRDETMRGSLSGVVLAADNALSARYALSELEEMGHRVLAVTGLLTSSPLCMREFSEIARTPVASSAGDASGLGATVAESLGLRTGAAAHVAA